VKTGLDIGQSCGQTYSGTEQGIDHWKVYKWYLTIAAADAAEDVNRW